MIIKLFCFYIYFSIFYHVFIYLSHCVKFVKCFFIRIYEGPWTSIPRKKKKQKKK